MLSKNYFDGGNEISGRDAQRLPYRVVTLAAMSGLKDHWDRFEREWGKILRKYRVPYLHTTDAVALSPPYSKKQGWDENKRDKFIDECAAVLEKRAAVSRVRTGVRLVSITVRLEDFRRALREHPEIDNPAHVCSLQATGVCLLYGDYIGAKQFELFFDQNEPFYGYIHDRWKTPRVRKAEPFWKRVSHVGESQMELVPGLQAADILAWSVNHAEQDRVIEYGWQERVLNIEREKQIFDYDLLCRPLTDSISRMLTWKLPKRRAYK